MWTTVFAHAFGDTFAKTDIPEVTCFILTLATVALIGRIIFRLFGLIPKGGCKN